MQSDRDRLYFCQTIQESISLYYFMPMVIIDSNNSDKLYKYCKNINFLDLNYDTKEIWFNEIKNILNLLPSFFNTSNQNRPLLEKLNLVKSKYIDIIENIIFITNPSLSPFFIEKLKEDTAIKCLNL